MRSLNVVVDNPNNMTVDKNSFLQNFYKMLPFKIDPNYGLYKVKLFKINNDGLIDVFNLMRDSVVDDSTIPIKSPNFFSITEICVCI